MRLGFSTLGCPDWDLETILAQASAMGYQAVELHGLQGETHLPAVPALTRDPEAVAARFRDAGVALACLATGSRLHRKDETKLSEAKARVRECLELAGRLGCPRVGVLAGEVPGGQTRESVLVRIADALRELAPAAAANRCTIVLENSGGFTGSRDVWFILDAVNHPAVRCCWNPCHARAGGERPTLSVPRLGTRIAMTHLVDGRFDERGGLASYVLPGQGEVGIERYLDILRGIACEGDMIFEWPKRWCPDLLGPEEAFPAALAAIRAMLDRLASTPELSAYKGDKNPARFAARPGPSAAR